MNPHLAALLGSEPLGGSGLAGTAQSPGGRGVAQRRSDARRLPDFAKLCRLAGLGPGLNAPRRAGHRSQGSEIDPFPDFFPILAPPPLPSAAS